ncbi:MAG: NADH-quinone oxidoreductase subunit D [Deltaproteobacteria bacterium]|nr:NADH-quinone oxidoreductase subunit D [Deltaproteobacteria bacterium]MDH4122019.1 NADH-quinone oxidoreductase subunit D [Deltaproteobacteria bacterium]
MKRSNLPLEFGAEPMDIEIGPSHPAMHGITRLSTRLDGEVVTAVEVEIGYLHRGFEKECENSTYVQVIPYTDRLNYVSPILNNIGYSLAVEKLFGLDVPKRAQYARVILGELSRISDHLTCNGAMGMEVGAMTVFLWYVKAREYLWELTEEVTGARLTHNWTRFGGNANDLPDTFFDMLEERLKKVEAVLEEGVKMLFKNKIFLDRVKDVGVLSRERAIEYGFTGPMLRATGEPYDLRRAEPYLVYNELDFEIPVGTVGDSYDRFLVRHEEMLQSISIIRQAVAKIPKGGHYQHDRRAWLPDKTEVYGSIEGLIDHFKVIMEGSTPPKGEVYQAIEGGNGELGFYLVSDGTGKPYKCRVRPPCFNFVSALPEMLIGHYVGDIVPIYGSINMIGGELER